MARRNLSAVLVSLAVMALGAAPAGAKPVKNDYHIDGADPGVRLFVRQKMEQGTTRFADDNIVLFVHGATAPSVCDFDLGFKDSTHFTLFEKPRFEFFNEILKFLKE